jgi:hypothetical protein
VLQAAVQPEQQHKGLRAGVRLLQDHQPLASNKGKVPQNVALQPKRDKCFYFQVSVRGSKYLSIYGSVHFQILRLLQYYPAPEKKEVYDRMCEVLAKILKDTVIQKNVNINNAAHSVLFEVTQRLNQNNILRTPQA